MPGYDTRTDSEASKVAAITAASLEPDTSRRVSLTVGTSVVSVAIPTGSWKYLKVINNGTSIVDERPIVTVAVGQDPTDSSGSVPALTWGIGYDVAMGQEIIPVNVRDLAQVRLKSTSANTQVVLNFII
jgi:hypothetical protein